MDVLCQAKSGMGKTVVFILSVLQQISPVPGEVSCVVLCHTRELALQVSQFTIRINPAPSQTELIYNQHYKVPNLRMLCQCKRMPLRISQLTTDINRLPIQLAFRGSCYESKGDGGGGEIEGLIRSLRAVTSNQWPTVQGFLADRE